MVISEAEENAVPEHLGVIPDGVRRWSRAHGVSLGVAYDLALARLAPLVAKALNAGVQSIALYAVSKDNLWRPSAEVNAVVGASINFFDAYLPDALSLAGLDVNVTFVGNLGLLPMEYQRAATRLATDTAHHEARRIYIVAAYSPVDELRQCQAGTVETMEELIGLLWVKHRINLVLRTGGAKNLSDFLPLQCGYAPLVVTETLINDIEWESFEKAFHVYRANPDVRGR